MNIGFVSTRFAGVDGVSLETLKLVDALKALGHDSFYCAGELDNESIPSRLVPRMMFNDPAILALNDAAFGSKPLDRHQLYAEADALRGELEAFIDQYNIDVLFPQNASCIPMNLPLGIAIRDVVERRQIPTICHHHDFYWERERFMHNQVQDILDTAFPPNLQPIQHITINTIMQKRLKSWRGIDAVYLPNVFDFSQPAPSAPDGVREALGIQADDIVFLQATRVIRRKGIEKSIELVRKLNDPRIILIITGSEHDEPGGYGAWLKEEAERAGIRYRFIADKIDMQGGDTVYSLWDIYPIADFVTYPSVYEGFGNALIETVYFRKPFIVHTYPMYLTDIRSVGVRGVEFSYDITPDVLDDVRRVLRDPAEMVERNFEAAKRAFGYDRLRDTLQGLLANV